MKLLKILRIMLLATTWTILFAYVLLHGSSDILYSVMGVSVAACYVFLAFYQRKEITHMSEAILQVTNLVKKIKGKTILDHISFEVGQGDCLALIGPNGAGKTTLMSCILGDKKASSGQVLIKGKKGKAQDQIAVLLQENTIPSQLKVKELIAFSKIFLKMAYLKKRYKHSYNSKTTSISSLRTNSRADKNVFLPLFSVLLASLTFSF